ncbi:MAG: S16 family serine protease [Candidatus Woesearchaeota archaeon]
MGVKKAFSLLFGLLLLVFLAAAVLAETQPYHLKLLAVQENESGKLSGSDADLYLELRAGTGRVFLDTYPLTKIDTQISTRFAKEIACKHYHLDCENYDFIYTIKAKSNIIGGPSAGAAISALTAIAMLDLSYREDVALTGTINSGATIGPVGGLKEKLEAASTAHLQKVLIPTGTSEQKPLILPAVRLEGENITINADLPFSNSSNHPFNLLTYGEKNLSLEVVEVSDLDEALFQLTGRKLNAEVVAIKIDSGYQQIMQTLQQTLCQRNAKIQEEMTQAGLVLDENVIQNVNDKTTLAENATKQEDYYSAASYCFGNNIALKFQYYNLSQARMENINTLFSQLAQKTNELSTAVDREKITTLTDLQALMIVKERLNEVQQQIKGYQEKKSNLTLEELYQILAYSEERYFSALSWKQFFSLEGKEFVLDNGNLKNSCQQKISEAEERTQEVALYFGNQNLMLLQEQIKEARASGEKKEEALCLMQALQAKAEADALLSSIGVGEENLPSFLESKDRAVMKVIAEANAEGLFPIMGYSYYQYAHTLRESQPLPALIYYEYALEMSDLSLYFSEKAIVPKANFNPLLPQKWEFFAVGVLVGLLVLLVPLIILNSRKKWGEKKNLSKVSSKKKRV